MTLWAQVVVGLAIIFFGIMVNLARSNPAIKAGIEKYVLGGEDLFAEGKDYQKVVGWLGWKSIILGLGILFPSSILIDIGLVVVIVYVVFRVRREYEKLKRTTTAKGGAHPAEA